MQKPVVHYKGTAFFYRYFGMHVVAGLSRVTDHPVLGYCRDVKTSSVLRVFSDGSFETRNTIYVSLDPEPCFKWEDGVDYSSIEQQRIELENDNA